MYSEIHQKITEAFRKGTYFPNLYKKHLAESLDSDIMQVIIEAAAKAACEVIDPVMQVVTETLIEHGWEYVGGDVAFKQVDAPLVSTLPARPNLIVNTAVGFWVGLVLSGLWISRYKKHSTFKAR
jgi:capsular polysaccharide biosynthesis protein